MSVIDDELSSDETCERNCRKWGFGVNLLKNCVGLALDPKESRSGNDFEYFSSDADRLFYTDFFPKKQFA